MRRGALTLGQILEEEFEYLTGKSPRCDEAENQQTELDLWCIRCRDRRRLYAPRRGQGLSQLDRRGA